MLPYGTQPRWLEHLLEVGFYADVDTCSVQTHRWKTVFCKTCMDGPFCDKCCWTNSHKNHDILRVCKASHRVAVPKEDITKDIDVDGIQPFIVNFKLIFFLHEKLKKSVQNCPKCQICQGYIKDPTYRFCSIACKVKSVQGINGEVDLQPINGLEVELNVQEVQLRPIRRHRRKGVPRRSLLK